MSPKKKADTSTGPKPNPAPRPGEKGGMDGANALRLLAAWEKWIGKSFAPEEDKGSFLVYQNLPLNPANEFEFEAERGVLTARFQCRVWDRDCDRAAIDSVLAKEPSPGLKKAKGWLEVRPPGPDEVQARICSTRGFGDPTLTDEQFCNLCRELVLAGARWRDKRFFDFNKAAPATKKG